MAVVVEEVFEVLGRGLGSFLAHEFEVLAQPLAPAGVVLPWDSIPEVEQLQVTLGAEGGDLIYFGLECRVQHLQGGHAGVVESFALCEDGDVLELVIVLTDVGEVCLSFAPVVGELLEFEPRGVLRTAF